MKLSHTEGEILQTWQREAARKITEDRDPVVAHAVVERVASTVASDIRINLTSEGDVRDSFVGATGRRIEITLPRQPDRWFIVDIIRRLDIRISDLIPPDVSDGLSEIIQNQADNLEVARVLHKFFPHQTSELAHALGGGFLTSTDPTYKFDDGVIDQLLDEPGVISGSIRLKIDNLVRALVTGEDFRIKTLRSMGQIPMLQAKLLCAALVRQGMRTLLNVRGRGDFLNPAKKSKRLMSKIGSSRCRKELEELYSLTHNAETIDAKEKEIAYRVFGEVNALYNVYAPYGHSVLDADQYAGGSPVYVVEHSNLTCFSGPWLQAALMLECGIDYDALLLCKTIKTAKRVLGGHCSLFLKTVLMDLMWIDPAMHIIESDFDFVSGQSPGSIKAMNALLNDEWSQSVFLKFPEKLIKDGRYPYEMQVMKLGAGLSSGHMLHVGISFLHERRLAEAEYAFDLALTFNRKDPDVWYYLGLVNSLKGNPREAEVCFKEAIRYFDEHLWSYFALGELAMVDGDVKLAKEYFEVVAKNTCGIFGDKSFRRKARKYARMRNRDLGSLWRGRC